MTPNTPPPKRALPVSKSTGLTPPRNYSMNDNQEEDGRFDHHEEPDNTDCDNEMDSRFDGRSPWLYYVCFVLSFSFSGIYFLLPFWLFNLGTRNLFYWLDELILKCFLKWCSINIHITVLYLYDYLPTRDLSEFSFIHSYLAFILG